MIPIDHAARLSAHDLRVTLDGNQIIPDMTLDIAPGRFTAIVGPNGCGKSTLLRTMIRLLHPSHGEITLDGVNARGLNARGFAKRLALLPQTAHAPSGITVRDLVARGRYPHQSLLKQWSSADHDAVEGALAATEMTDLGDRLVDDLSGGQRQRVWVAMVLAQQTEVVLLDEPTTFLDIAHQHSLLELVREMVRAQGRTVIAVLHDLQQAAHYADDLVVMRAGTVISHGPPAEVLTADLISDVFGLDCRLVVDEASGASMIIPNPAPPPDLSSIPPLITKP
ncbi:ABC transporter ATP-binding protein [Cumulibacter soli]|uniref:ABC transporter ATP-binding protein n=1 Tax=Cumulibacter soli TaxID=2546344 RepID=UPI001068C9E8|nr:ABC transporter ATP-binding protein [Cumulibacter soli]